jgi:hypothetical protein
MTDDEWIPLVMAAQQLARAQRAARWRIPERSMLRAACWRIQQALMLGTVRARGVIPPGVRSDIPPEGLLVEIEAREFASLGLDCGQSRVVPSDGKRLWVTMYRAVEVTRPDIEALAREREEDVALAPPEGKQTAAPTPPASEISSKAGPVGLSDRFAGRPSLKSAILVEMEDRIAKRLECDTLAAEAHYLFGWAQTRYPGDRHLPGREKSLQNTLRDKYRRLRADRDKPTK